MLIGATRCDDKYENAIMLETQAPCGSVRKCSAGTVTNDTSAQVKVSHTRNSWRHFRRTSKQREVKTFLSRRWKIRSILLSFRDALLRESTKGRQETFCTSCRRLPQKKKCFEVWETQNLWKMRASKASVYKLHVFRHCSATSQERN